MSISVIKTTQGNQVSNELEKRISAGIMTPGCKIPSTRELASEFNVSRQVIESALDFLEERKLILRQSRVGVYVNPESFSPDKKELCLLRLQTGERIADYPEKILSISDIRIWHGFNVSIRAMSDRHYSRGILLYELEKLHRMHIDCLLVYIPCLQERDMSRFKKLPFPVVFLGDSIPDGKIGKVENQIVEDTADRARAMIVSAAHHGYRNAVMLGGPLEKYYCRIMKSSGENAAREFGVTFHYLEHEEGECGSTEELISVRRAAIKKVLARWNPDILLLDGYRQIDMFVDALEVDAGLKTGRDVGILCDGEICSGTIFLKSDYSALSTEIARLISVLIAESDKPIGRVVLPGLIKRNPLKIGMN